MRHRAELIGVSIVVALLSGLTWRQLQAEVIEGEKCGGERNCVGDPCIDPLSFSCAEVTPIDHPFCARGNHNDTCDEFEVDCARVQYFSGGDCGDFGVPADECLGSELPDFDIEVEDGCELDDGPPGPDDN